MTFRVFFTTAVILLINASPLTAQPFQLPTANNAIFESGGEEKFFVGTVGKPWTSGTFGCVRSEGTQIHEGLDIRALQRDKQGESTDPVMATADGVVTYVNRKSSLSTYGIYVVIRHQIEGIEIYSLYAHLREARADLKSGTPVKAKEAIGVVGRTANTREGISKERAHLHFELNLLVNDNFSAWYKKNFPKQRNDHGQWNGQNLVGLDPRAIFLEQRKLGDKFSLLRFIQARKELCRVQVRDTDFPWVKRYKALIIPNPKAASEGTAGYELALDFNAVPFQFTPRSESELKSKSRYHLLSVNEAEQSQKPCRKLVAKKGGKWELTSQGQKALDMLTY